MWHDCGVKGGGLYWLIPATVTGLAGGVISAWLFLLAVPRPRLTVRV